MPVFISILYSTISFAVTVTDPSLLAPTKREEIVLHPSWQKTSGRFQATIPKTNKVYKRIAFREWGASNEIRIFGFVAAGFLHLFQLSGLTNNLCKPTCFSLW